MNNITIIPGVGKSIAKDLQALGIHQVSDLKDKDPQALYDQLCQLQGYQDRCVLYVFRCAVYFANGGRNQEKLKWWNWKDIKK